MIDYVKANNGRISFMVSFYIGRTAFLKQLRHSYSTAAFITIKSDGNNMSDVAIDL